MATSTLTSKNQTTIPRAVVDALGLKPAGKLVYEIEGNGRVILTSKSATFASVAALFPKKLGVKPRTIEEMKDAVTQQAVNRSRRAAK